MGWPAPSPIFKARRGSATEYALAKIEGREFLNVLLCLALGHHTAVDTVETGKTPFEKSVSDRSFEMSEAKYFSGRSAHESFFSHRLLKQARREFDAHVANCLGFSRKFV
jgi:hypothetical protein